jgi:hypothetical protein
MKEYQIKSETGNVLPREVYYQCIWIVRDLDRMKGLISRRNAEEYLIGADRYRMSRDLPSMVSEGTAALKAGRDVLEAEFKVECINQALLEIPEEYREGVIELIISRGGKAREDMAHMNTWKKWKQRFIYRLAVNLGLYG